MGKDKTYFDGYRTAVKDMKHLSIDRVVYNNPVTIVFWSDGTKTVVKCRKPDKYDRRTGVLLCCAKRLLGHDKDWFDQLDPEATHFFIGWSDHTSSNVEGLGAAYVEYTRV